MLCKRIPITAMGLFQHHRFFFEQGAAARVVVCCTILCLKILLGDFVLELLDGVSVTTCSSVRAGINQSHNLLEG